MKFSPHATSLTRQCSDSRSRRGEAGTAGAGRPAADHTTLTKHEKGTFTKNLYRRCSIFLFN
jgi:hypothetical protein